MRSFVALCFVVMIVYVVQANAAEGQFSLYAGYLNPGSLNLDNVRTGLSLRGTSLYGARTEFDFLKIFGIEENVAFSPRLFNSTLFPNGTGSDVRGFLYSTNFVINAPMQRFVPYVSGGVGLVKPWGIGFRTFDATFAGNYGGGIKLNRLAGPIGIRFDVRGWRTADIANRGGVNIFEATGGVTISWGGKHK
jgi:hypothetical protein